MSSSAKSKWPFSSFWAFCVISFGVLGFSLYGVGVYFAFRTPPPNPLPADKRKAKDEVLRWVPLGTSLKDAEAKMKDHKFICNVAHEKNGTDLLVASVEGSGWIVYGMWIAAFKIEEGKVVDLSVEVRVVGP